MVNIALTVALILFRILGQSVLQGYEGLFQRVFALVTTVPIGVAAWFLAATVKNFTAQP
jgi:multidrug transporter EmrE-like cation transporter